MSSTEVRSSGASSGAGARRFDLKLEVVLIPREQAGEELST
jgi:hypothetical protein